MKREEEDILFKRDSDDKLIFNPKGESQPKFLFREFKNRLSYLRGEIASCEKNIDLLLGKGEKKKEILNMIELELFKRQLEIDREKFESIRNWFSQNKINEPGSLEEKFEKQQRNKILDTYIKRLRQKITKEMESAKGEKIEAESRLTITKKGCLDLCEKLLNSEYKMTDEEEKISKHKTFSKWRYDFMRDPKNDMYKNFPSIMSELEKQTFISYSKFASIINAPSDYYYKVLLNSFTQACNIKGRQFAHCVRDKRLKVIEGTQDSEMGLKLTGKL